MTQYRPCLFLVLLTFSMATLILWGWLLYSSLLSVGGDGRIAPDNLKKSMRYHGVQVAEWRGEWGFMRQGYWIPISRRAK